MAEEKIQWYQEVSLAVGPDDVDPVSNYIIDNISTGLLLEDEEGNSHTVIKFYVAGEEDINDKLEGLKIYLSDINPGVAPEFTCKKLKNMDWIEAYKNSVTPVEVVDSIVIKPPWSDATYTGKTEIVIEPKMAFGTGRHETSRSCLAEMENLDFTGKIMLDLGCGSGILAIYAALKGAREVDGFDIDPLAVENSQENFILNGVADQCRVIEGGIDIIPAGKTYDIVVVNIIKKVILPILGQLKTKVKPGGILILSGLLGFDRDEIARALEEVGLSDFTIRPDAEWITYTIRVN